MTRQFLVGVGRLACWRLPAAPDAARGGFAGAQGRPVGNEDGADRRADARDDDAALHRRDHRQGDEHGVLADGKEMCSKQDIQKTATGYVSDSVCGVAGMTITSHAEITGDFNSAYTVKSTSHSERGPGRRAARFDHDHRGEVAGGLQGRPEARRHHDARRHEDEHQGHGKAEGHDPEAATADNFHPALRRYQSATPVSAPPRAVRPSGCRRA